MITGTVLALAQLAPAIIGMFSKSDKAQQAAEIVSDVARSITGKDSDSEALEILKADPNKLIEFQAQVNTHAANMFAEETKRLESVNKTIREETHSADPYVRRMRPTYGYALMFCIVLMFATITGQVLAGKPMDSVVKLIKAYAEMSSFIEVALAVLGVYVYKRSHDKSGKQGVVENVLKKFNL